jgi:hypothetical protein
MTAVIEKHIIQAEILIVRDKHRKLKRQVVHGEDVGFIPAENGYIPVVIKRHGHFFHQLKMFLVFGYGIVHIRFVIHDHFFANAPGKKFERQRVENKGNDNDDDKTEKQLRK